MCGGIRGRVPSAEAGVDLPAVLSRPLRAGLSNGAAPRLPGDTPIPSLIFLTVGIPHSIPKRSGNQQQFAGCFSALQLDVSLLYIFQCIDVLDAEFEFSGSDHTEHGAGTFLEILAREDIVAQRRPGHEQRSLLRELDEIERGHGATRASA